ncbi:MAG: hypothetical protein ACX94A_05535 [Algiphilus sp.]
MNESGAFQALDVALPGLTQYLWLSAVALGPLAFVLLMRTALPGYQRLPAPVASGIPLALGIIGATVAAIGCWLISVNGVWRDDDNLYLRASRAFSADIPLADLRTGAARPLRFDALEPIGRIRTPGYAAGWYEDSSGRKIFVLWAGQTLTRIPTDRDYDLAFAMANPEALKMDAAGR